MIMSYSYVPLDHMTDIHLWALMDISSTAGCTLVSCGSQRLATVLSGEKSTDRMTPLG